MPRGDHVIDSIAGGVPARVPTWNTNKALGYRQARDPEVIGVRIDVDHQRAPIVRLIFHPKHLKPEPTEHRPIEKCYFFHETSLRSLVPEAASRPSCLERLSTNRRISNAGRHQLSVYNQQYITKEKPLYDAGPSKRDKRHANLTV
jgi:hypothetical protein